MALAEEATIIDGLFNGWGTASWLAGGLFGLTLIAGNLLNPDRKEEIALWLMGAESEETWSRSFCSLFDAIFGERHFSADCFFRSAVASMFAVVVIWLLIGNVSAIGVRFQTDLSLGSILVYAVAVNVFADYVSLLETRFVLSRLHRIQSWLAQLIILIADLVLSALVIWFAIQLFVGSPLYSGEADSFAEILGVFSVFSVLFYSTFLTSVWSWAYVASTGILRLFAKLQLAKHLDVENNPLMVLGAVLAVVVFVATTILGLPLSKNNEGLTPVDRALCGLFKGPVCLDVASLTQAEQAQLEMIFLACEGGLTEECFSRSFSANGFDKERLLLVACDAGEFRACTNLGAAYSRGTLREPNFTDAVMMFNRGCNEGAGDTLGCSNLGLHHEKGEGVPVNYEEAARLYRLECDGGGKFGCSHLGRLYEYGLGVDVDYVEAAGFYKLGCDLGNNFSCVRLGHLYEEGLGLEKDFDAAGSSYLKACDAEWSVGCFSLGLLLGNPLKRGQTESAAAYFEEACRLNLAEGCGRHGNLLLYGIGVAKNAQLAEQQFAKGCELLSSSACIGLADMRVGKDVEQARSLYEKACEGDHMLGCLRLEELDRDTQ